jgi:hypothetical protein
MRASAPVKVPAGKPAVTWTPLPLPTSPVEKLADDPDAVAWHGVLKSSPRKPGLSLFRGDQAPDRVVDLVGLHAGEGAVLVADPDQQVAVLLLCLHLCVRAARAGDLADGHVEHAPVVVVSGDLLLQREGQVRPVAGLVAEVEGEVELDGRRAVAVDGCRHPIVGDLPVLTVRGRRCLHGDHRCENEEECEQAQPEPLHVPSVTTPGRLLLRWRPRSVPDRRRCVAILTATREVDG